MHLLRAIIFALALSLLGGACVVSLSDDAAASIIAPPGEDDPLPRSPEEGLFPTHDRTCDAEFVTDDLTGNRHNRVPANRVQVVLFYDGAGSGSPELRIGLDGGRDIVVEDIEPFGRRIETREYALSHDCRLTGEFEISATVPNGVVDGLAFGVLWTDEVGRARMVKSSAAWDGTGTGVFVGRWPLGFSRDWFTERTPQIDDPFGREAARAIIIGAELLPDGVYDMR